MTFWDVATSNILWILVGLGLLYVLVLSAVFMVKGWKRCLQLGIDEKVVKKVVTSSITFSIIPSMSIIIGLVSLSAVIGAPWAWFRLSVVGSLTYELMAADMVGKAMGFESLTLLKSEPAVAMGAVMIVMSIGILSGNIANIFFAKKISTSLTAYNEKSGGWGAMFSSSFMITMIGIMAVVQLFGGMANTLTFASSLLVAMVTGYIAKTFKIAWMGDFILSIALVVGMASGVMWHNLFA